MPGATSFYRQLVEFSQDAILSKDLDAVITSWNEAATRLYGYCAEEAIGSPVSIIIPPERQGEEFGILEAVMHGEPIDHYETERVAKDGRRLNVSLSVSPIRDDEGNVVGVATIARDITERKQTESRLLFLAHHDPLTGLFNRARFEEELEQRLRHAQRYDRPGAVLAIDLDDFKVVNDTWGHAAGDAVLQKVAAALREHVRDADVVARMGGDEFAVVMNEISSHQAVRVACKLQAQIGCRWEGREVSASIGVVPFDGGRELTAAALMVAADIALYDAKDAGRARVAKYSGRRSANLGWVTRIRRALDEDRLVLEAQPILDLHSGEICSEELLVRVRGEDGELIPPSSFLPTAERFRLVHEIDRWVCDRAMELACQGRNVAVNLSGLSISDRRLLSQIKHELGHTGADPSRLTFEITETAALSRLNEVLYLAQRLAELGCSFALDDFGTGFGHFSCLKLLPLKYLKIDREFVRDLTENSTDRHVVKAVVAIAHGFGHLTIAEGVESEATLRALPRYGVDCAQGFHVGRPRPLDEPLELALMLTEDQPTASAAVQSPHRPG